MTRHFTGKVTTIWALGAGDEAESGGDQAQVTTRSPPRQTGSSDSEKSRLELSSGEWEASGWPEPEPELPVLQPQPR